MIATPWLVEKLRRSKSKRLALFITTYMYMNKILVHLVKNVERGRFEEEEGEDERKGHLYNDQFETSIEQL